LVPEAHLARLVAVFNGGFKTEHGRHGMFVDGVTLVPPRPRLCTIAGFADGTVRIGTWEALALDLSTPRAPVRFWRQAAPCLVEGGKLHPGLRDRTTQRWGATLTGETVVRRSAIGVDRSAAILYVAITNDTTARALAEAMRHAGAVDVAQLDINWSYPKFVLFPADGAGVRHAESLFDGFLVGPNDYVRKSSPRDFFYLTTAIGGQP
jgi:hypothetical protein